MKLQTAADAAGRRQAFRGQKRLSGRKRQGVQEGFLIDGNRASVVE